jgi:hypothetical protein
MISLPSFLESRLKMACTLLQMEPGLTPIVTKSKNSEKGMSNIVFI